MEVMPVEPVLYHFSEDPSIRRFVPHVPQTNPIQQPAVWAIDANHAPLYWFPRDCPRVTAWPRGPEQAARFRRDWHTTAERVHAIESAWLDRMRSVSLYRYDLPATSFVPWPDAAGQWVAHQPVEPMGIEPMDDLLDLHTEAGIELRIVPSLWPLWDLARGGPWDFSIVRTHNARPREDQPR